MKRIGLILLATILLSATAFAASYEVEYHGVIGAIFINATWKDTDECAVYVMNPRGLQLKTFAFLNECQEIEAPSGECLLQPDGSFLVYSIHLDETIRPANGYQLCATCNNKTSCHDFNVTAPQFIIQDFNQYPQLLTPMKIMARVESHMVSICVIRIINTEDGTTTSMKHGINCGENGYAGMFVYEQPLILENLYKNYTLNITCDNYATYETTFKPVIIDIGSFAVTGVGISLEFTLILAAVLVIVIFLFAAIFMKDTIQGLLERWNL